jgi:hypothetical protein
MPVDLMKVALGKFASFCIDARLGDDMAARVRDALQHYARQVDSATAPLPFPGFCRDQAPDGLGAEFELAVDPEIQARLAREARRQHVQLEQLLVHAVFVYLADLDSGVSKVVTA